MEELGVARHSSTVSLFRMNSDAISLVAHSDAQSGYHIAEVEPRAMREARIETPADAYAAYFEVVWRNLRRLGVTPETVEDAVQDVFLVVHRRWEDFRHQSTVRTWVIGICLRVAREYRRKRLRVAQDQEICSDIAVSPDSPLATVERLQATRTLMMLLDGFDENQRNVFVLVELEELSVAEAAEAIGIPVSTAYKRLTNAHRLFERAVSRQQAHDGWRFGWKR